MSASGAGEVVALRFDEEAIAQELADWCGGEVRRAGDPDRPGHTLTTIDVPTAKGPQPAVLGDWIVRYGDRHFQPYSPLEFAAKHEPL